MKTYSGRPYKELVEEGKRVVAADNATNWELGDLAVQYVGPPGQHGDNQHSEGGGDLKQFAEDISVEYDRLRSCRVVAAAWRSDARHSTVPWVCYRTIYTAENRTDTMTTFIMACEESGEKPGYRLFQQHIGKPKTREYTRANAQETAGQALDDLEPEDQAKVIVPRVREPKVARAVVKDPDARHTLSAASHDEVMGRMAHETPAPINLPTGVVADLAYIRILLKKVYDQARDPAIGWDGHRASVPAELRSIAAMAEMVAAAIEDPASVTFSDTEAAELFH